MLGDLETTPARLYRSSFVWDSHSGFAPDPRTDLTNLSIWHSAGVHFLSINVGFDLMPWQASVSTIAAFRHWLLAHRDQYLLVESFDDIAAARNSGRMAVAFDLEGMVALDGRIEMVEFYRTLGIRQMLFAYNRNNGAGGGCHDEDGGLTGFGRAVIDEMNRVGMTVDVSHCGYRTSMEAMERSKAPVVFSHSNASALTRHGRNINDEQIRACAATGGVIGAVGLSLFMGSSGADISRFADHLEHLINVAGPDHVGLGLDYAFPVDFVDLDKLITENAEYWPKADYPNVHVEFVSPARLLDLTEEMLIRGHSDHVVRGVLGANFLRVAKKTWR
jgi:membrane dipeptidase